MLQSHAVSCPVRSRSLSLTINYKFICAISFNRNKQTLKHHNAVFLASVVSIIQRSRTTSALKALCYAVASGCFLYLTFLFSRVTGTTWHEMQLLAPLFVFSFVGLASNGNRLLNNERKLKSAWFTGSIFFFFSFIIAFSFQSKESAICHREAHRWHWTPAVAGRWSAQLRVASVRHYQRSFVFLQSGWDTLVVLQPNNITQILENFNPPMKNEANSQC